MHYMLTALTVAGLFVTTGCAFIEGGFPSGEKSAETVAATNTAGENSADSGAEVKAAGETQATARRCRSYRPTGSHKSVRSCTGASGGDSKAQAVDLDEWKRETIMRGVINTRDRTTGQSPR